MKVKKIRNREIDVNTLTLKIFKKFYCNLKEIRIAIDEFYSTSNRKTTKRLTFSLFVICF